MTTLFSILFSLGAFAAPQNIEIDSKLYFHGQRVGAPRILTENGKAAKIIMNDQKQAREYNLEVIPTLASNDLVRVNYTIAIREKANETISRGSVNIEKNKKSRVSLDHGRIQLHLKIKNS